MNEQWDAFERELQTMRPRELPQDVGRRIAHSLGRDSRATRRPAAWWWGGLIATAACLAIAAAAWHLRSSQILAPQNTGPDRGPLAAARVPDATLGSYKLAFARSDNRFDELLDKEATRPLATTDRDSRPIRPFDLNLIP
jgi:hypothetical protein